MDKKLNTNKYAYDSIFIPRSKLVNFTFKQNEKKPNNFKLFSIENNISTKFKHSMKNA